MKYNETKVVDLGVSLAKIRENSGPAMCYFDPQLTIMTPRLCGSSSGEPPTPATSQTLRGSEVHKLYELLKQYYEEPTT